HVIVSNKLVPKPPKVWERTLKTEVANNYLTSLIGLHTSTKSEPTTTPSINLNYTTIRSPFTRSRMMEGRSPCGRGRYTYTSALYRRITVIITT
ncbi:hypothetical protein J6590_017542, partial [Homalodisca vitripennis]